MLFVCCSACCVTGHVYNLLLSVNSKCVALVAVCVAVCIAVYVAVCVAVYFSVCDAVCDAVRVVSLHRYAISCVVPVANMLCKLQWVLQLVLQLVLQCVSQCILQYVSQIYIQVWGSYDQ